MNNLANAVDISEGQGARVPLPAPQRRIQAPGEVTVKAVQFERVGGPEVIRLVDLPVPQPGPQQVRVKVSACGLNFSDIMIRQGRYVMRDSEDAHMLAFTRPSVPNRAESSSPSGYVRLILSLESSLSSAQFAPIYSASSRRTD